MSVAQMCPLKEQSWPNQILAAQHVGDVQKDSVQSTEAIMSSQVEFSSVLRHE